jgi:hypothetical protein
MRSATPPTTVQRWVYRICLERFSSDLEGRFLIYPDYNAIDADKAIEFLTAQTTESGGFEDVPSELPGATLSTDQSHVKNHTSRDPDDDKGNDRDQAGDNARHLRVQPPDQSN